MKRLSLKYPKISEYVFIYLKHLNFSQILKLYYCKTSVRIVIFSNERLTAKKRAFCSENEHRLLKDFQP